MIWLTWRQHRQQALFGTAAFGLVAVFLLLTRLHMGSVFHDSGLARCLDVRGHGECSNLESSFESRFSVLRQLVPFLMLVPLFVGMFWGAPLVARELEEATHRLVWTQGISRLRWFSTKLALVFAFGLLAAVVYALLITWWWGPLNGSTGTRFEPGIFDQQGLVPVAYTLFALAFGTAAGAIMGKTLPAMAATIVGFLIPRLGIGALLRRHYASPVTSSYAPVAGTSSDRPGAWVISDRTFDRLGRRISEFDIAAACHAGNGSSVRLFDHCVRQHGFLNVVVFQPAHRFWLFQGIESGIYVALALVCLALAVWWVRERVS